MLENVWMYILRTWVFCVFLICEKKFGKEYSLEIS